MREQLGRIERAVGPGSDAFRDVSDEELLEWMEATHRGVVDGQVWPPPYKPRLGLTDEELVARIRAIQAARAAAVVTDAPPEPPSPQVVAVEPPTTAPPQAPVGPAAAKKETPQEQAARERRAREQTEAAQMLETIEAVNAALDSQRARERDYTPPPGWTPAPTEFGSNAGDALKRALE